MILKILLLDLRHNGTSGYKKKPWIEIFENTGNFGMCIGIPKKSHPEATSVYESMPGIGKENSFRIDYEDDPKPGMGAFSLYFEPF